MGYDTSFDGMFRLDRPVKREHKVMLDDLATDEHTSGEDGKHASEARSGRPDQIEAVEDVNPGPSWNRKR